MINLETSELSKYFAISFCSHAALIALLLSANGEADQGKTQHYGENNIVIDMIPIIQGTVNLDDAAARKDTLNPPETTFPSSPDRRVNLNSVLANKKQKLKIHPYDKSSPVINATGGSKTSPQLKPTNPNYVSPPGENFTAIKTHTFVEAEVLNMDKTQTVPFIETLTPTPKPEVKHDFLVKNLASKTRAQTNTTKKPKYPLTSNLRQQNTSSAKARTKEILQFNNEFMSQLDSTKNVQFSAKPMPKQNHNNDPSISLGPNFIKDQANRQCKLIPRQKTGLEPNIREIQKQIQSRGVTISNILTYRSQQKVNEITISSLLASQLNMPAYNQRRASANIRFLLNTNSFHDYGKDLVCAPY